MARIGSPFQSNLNSFTSNNHTLSLTVPAGLSNSILVITKSCQTSLPWTTFVNVSVNGSTTGVVDAGSSTTTGIQRSIRAWYVLNPTPGTYNVVGSWSTSSSNGGLMSAVLYDGIDQTAPLQVATEYVSGGSIATPIRRTFAVAAAGNVLAHARILNASAVAPGGSATGLGTEQAEEAVWELPSGSTEASMAWTGTSPQQGSLVALLLNPVADGLPPTGTVTIGTITPGTTSAQIAYTYSAGDATGFEYRLGSGTWMALGPSPATIGSLSASTAYELQIRATNASGGGAASAAQPFTTGAGGATVPVAFSESVPAQSATRGVPFSIDLASYFSGTQTPFTYGLQAGSLAGTGLSLSGSVIGGTPSGSGLVSGLVVRATDAAANTANSNAFAIDIAAPAGSITTEVMLNNTGTPQANRAVHWSWLAGGRIGALASVTPIDGAGTSDAGGRLTVSGLPTGAGVLLVAVREVTVADDAVYWQPGVVA